MNDRILQGHIVTEKQILYNHEIRIDGGIIESIELASSPAVQSDLPYILPGFREQHAHDWIGQSQSSQHREEILVGRFRQIMRSFACQGVTAAYAATFGGPMEELERYCRAAKQWMDDPGNGRDGAKLLGIHIEGTFINAECRGAQPAEHCLNPKRDDCIGALNRFNQTGAVRIVNIVPDYGKESLHAIRHATDLGMIVGSGHTKSSANHLRQAFEKSGLKFMVHFTNGPTGQSFKPFGGGGAFEGGMSLPIVKELILDRIHIDDRYILDIIHRTEERWGIEKIIGVTDSLFVTPDEIPPGEFTIGSTAAGLDPTGRFLIAKTYLQPDGTQKPAPSNTLCSSILTMDRLFGNLVTLFTQSIQGIWFDHPALSLDRAVVKAARICSTHQAMLDGSYDSTGSIVIGKDADLVVGSLIKEENDYTFQIQKVFGKGNCIFERAENGL